MNLSGREHMSVYTVLIQVRRKVWVAKNSLRITAAKSQKLVEFIGVRKP